MVRERKRRRADGVRSETKGAAQVSASATQRPKPPGRRQRASDDEVSRVNTFCFTWHIESVEQWEVEEEPEFRKAVEKYCNFAVWKPEAAPQEDGRLTIHIQGYCELKGMRFRIPKQPQNLFFHGLPVHIDKRRGQPQEAIAYVEKEETKVGEVRRFGKPDPVHATRRARDVDLVRTITNMVAENKTPANLLQTEFADYFLKNTHCARAVFNGVRTLAASNLPSKREEIYVGCIWGEPRTGKSHFCNTIAEEIEKGGGQVIRISSTDVDVANGKLWLDGKWANNSRACVLLVEECGSEIPIVQFLQLTDVNPVTIQIKGQPEGYDCKFVVVLFTSNVDPMTWFVSSKNATAMRLDAARRRFREMFQFVTATSSLECCLSIPYVVASNLKHLFGVSLEPLQRMGMVRVVGFPYVIDGPVPHEDEDRTLPTIFNECYDSDSKEKVFVQKPSDVFNVAEEEENAEWIQ